MKDLVENYMKSLSIDKYKNCKVTIEKYNPESVSISIEYYRIIDGSTVTNFEVIDLTIWELMEFLYFEISTK